MEAESRWRSRSAPRPPFETDLRLDELGDAIGRLAERVWEQASRKRGIGRTITPEAEDRPLSPSDAQPYADRGAGLGRRAGRAGAPAARPGRSARRHALPAGGGGHEQFPDGEEHRARQVELFGMDQPY